MSQFAEPKKTSTPTNRLRSRRPIHDESVQSPIPTEDVPYSEQTEPKLKRGTNSPSPRPRPLRGSRSPGSRHSGVSGSESEFSDHEEDGVGPQVGHSAAGSQNTSNTDIICYGIFAIVFLVGVCLGFYNVDGNQEKMEDWTLDKKIKELSNNFGKQHEDFWISVQVGIQEVKKFEQPRTFLLTYNSFAEDTLQEIVSEVSKLATCELSNCNANPIVIEGSSLNHISYLDDYGKLISEYHDKLEKTGVMVVKNLQEVPGTVAQAFHSICDEYNPSVKKAIIIFTLKTDDAVNDVKPVKYVEDLLKRLWSELPEDDKFYPLFTRISANTFNVIKE